MAEIAESDGQNNADEFYYSKESKVWEVGRENVLIPTVGARALLMQLAHPLVARAVYEHSSLRERPLERLYKTLDLTLDLIFGTKEKVHKTASRINRAHQSVKGMLPEASGAHEQGMQYFAKDPELITWVGATLIDSAIVGYERFVRPLSPQEKEDFYQDWKKISTFLGGEDSAWPETYQDFQKYMTNMVESGKVKVGREAKELYPYVFLRRSPVMKVLGQPFTWMTTGLLPAELRTQYGQRWSETDKRILDTVTKVSRGLIPYLPPPLRFSPKYLSAMKKSKPV